MGGVFDVVALKFGLEALEEKAQNPDLWNDKKLAQKVMKEKSILQEKYDRFLHIENGVKEAKEYLELAQAEGDEGVIKDIEKSLMALKKFADDFEIECVFSGENDINGCFIDLNAGAGGTDSCDFALMLMRMYERFCGKRNFGVEVVNILDGEEAGIRSATLRISGKYAYGWLKNEIGVHRLVRISPFNSSGKRQTSFASIWVYPEIDDEVEIEILEKDLRVDTFRASGAGGQHVNKTDSAVRMTHIPTNIVVQCQSDRSQIRNRAQCMKMLKSKLYEAEMQKKQDAANVAENAKTENSFGYQIRSYVLHPYQLVKDLRTSFESGNIGAVLDGEIEDFIKASLTKK